MGISKAAVWFAVFAIVANAGSGLGLELASPVSCEKGTTVCDAQLMIAALLDNSTPTDICGLQVALDATCEGESALTPATSLELTLQVRSPGNSESLAALPQIELLSLTVDLAKAVQENATPTDSPPDLHPAERLLRSVHSPNAPPYLT